MRPDTLFPSYPLSSIVKDQSGQNDCRCVRAQRALSPAIRLGAGVNGSLLFFCTEPTFRADE